MNRREFGLGACASLCAFPLSSHAQQDWPNKPVKLIVPFAAGSSPDANMRAFANEYGQVIKQAMVVENRPGANGISGTISGLSSPADGYTMIYVSAGTVAINPYLFPKQKYDPSKDLRFIGLTSAGANVLVVRRDLPVKNVRELIALAKAQPGALSMGSSGTGTTGHLSGELFKEMAGISAVHVPYKGSGPAYIDLQAGRIDFMIDNLVSLGTQDKDGRVRALAVTTAQRNPILPNVPTLKESGLTEYEVSSWGGIVVPRETPEDIVVKMRTALDTIKKSPTYINYFKQAGGYLYPPMTDAELHVFVMREQKKWSEIVRKSGASNT